MAIREQYLRKRLALRSQDNGGVMSFKPQLTNTVEDYMLLIFPEIKSNIFRREEPTMSQV